MARKGIKKQFWLTEAQANDLSEKASLTSLNEVTLIRMLLAGYHPPEAPPPSFYEDMNALLDAAVRMEEVARNSVDKETKTLLRQTAEELKELRIKILREYLSGERSDWRWR